MKEIENILKKEVDKFKQNAPKSDGSLNGLEKRLTYSKTGLDQLNKDVNKALNKYISDNNLDDDKIKKIEKFCTTYLSKEISSFF